ncbi:MAG: hypothetical protein ACLTAI_09835 [Thomasclavelia sp.]
MIDFVLSNCSNSGIDTVGVLTPIQTTNIKFPYRNRRIIGI